MPTDYESTWTSFGIHSFALHFTITRVMIVCRFYMGFQSFRYIRCHWARALANRKIYMNKTLRCIFVFILFRTDSNVSRNIKWTFNHSQFGSRWAVLVIGMRHTQMILTRQQNHQKHRTKLSSMYKIENVAEHSTTSRSSRSLSSIAPNVKWKA